MVVGDRAMFKKQTPAAQHAYQAVKSQFGCGGLTHGANGLEQPEGAEAVDIPGVPAKKAAPEAIHQNQPTSTWLS